MEPPLTQVLPFLHNGRFYHKVEGSTDSEVRSAPMAQCPTRPRKPVMPRTVHHKPVVHPLRIGAVAQTQLRVRRTSCTAYAGLCTPTCVGCLSPTLRVLTRTRPSVPVRGREEQASSAVPQRALLSPRASSTDATAPACGGDQPG